MHTHLAVAEYEPPDMFPVICWILAGGLLLAAIVDLIQRAAGRRALRRYREALVNGSPGAQRF